MDANRKWSEAFEINVYDTLCLTGTLFPNRSASVVCVEKAKYIRHRVKTN